MSELRVAEITSAQELVAAGELYRSVFGYTQPEATLNPRLLMAMVHNGGSMVGAWQDDRLVGFGYGFTGHSGEEFYLYSQAVVVAQGLQGSGVGRLIKNEQRRIALGQGLHAMRWAFNPVLSRNAHFNLSVLGATGRWFTPDCYGDGESRMVVEWKLDGEPAPKPALWPDYQPAALGTATWHEGIAAVAVPADPSLADPALVETLDTTLAELFGSGARAVACLRLDPTTAIYLFETTP